jgi:hypothetical protein
VHSFGDALSPARAGIHCRQIEFFKNIPERKILKLRTAQDWIKKSAVYWETIVISSCGGIVRAPLLAEPFPRGAVLPTSGNSADTQGALFRNPAENFIVQAGLAEPDR